MKKTPFKKVKELSPLLINVIVFKTASRKTIMTSCLVPFDVYVKGRTVKLCTEFDPDKTWNFQQFLFKSGSPVNVKVFRKAINSERMFKYSSMARIGLYFIGGFHTRQILKSRGIELPFLSSEDILKLTI